MKNNKGYTLSIVIVIMAVLGILTSSILFAANNRTNKVTQNTLDVIERIEIETNLYEYLNNVVLNSNIPTNTQTSKYDITIIQDEINSSIYILKINKINQEDTCLESQIKFSDDFKSYKIISWRFS